MTIVRELVTKLGFQVDKTGLDKFEKSIIGFKTKFALTSAAITAVVSKTLNYFSDIGRAAVSTQQLAEQTKIATEQLIAMREAAKDFYLDPEQFDSYFKRLSEGLREGKAGFGTLIEAIQRSRGKLNLTPFFQTGDVKAAFDAILDYVGSLKDVQDQVAALKHIFGEDNPQGLLAIVKAGKTVFDEASKANLEYAKTQAQTTANLGDYNKNLQVFYREIKNIEILFVQNILPAVTEALRLIGDAFKGFGVIKEQFNEGGFLGGAKFLGNAFADPVLGLFGYDSLSRLKREQEEEQADFQRRVEEYKTQNNIRSPTTINNRVDINVAPGTSQEQAQMIGAGVREAMQEFWDEKTREIQNNNPQAE